MENIDTKDECLTSSGNIANTLLDAAFSSRSNPVSELYNMDCVEGMKHYPDKYFDLAIVDPPYGIDINMNLGRRKGKRKKHTDKDWDVSIPDDEYFLELWRVYACRHIYQE